MCGINGVFKYQRLDLDKILKMNSVTSKRGPDFDSIYHDSDVIFGHNRLAIIDPDVKSNQPFISNDKSIVLTYNGELYNYLDLRKQLEKHYDFITNSDTEVVVAAYQHWGIKMLDYFNGMFAFALWDKHNNQFFLSRDRLGIKPLYFTENNQSVVFFFFTNSSKFLCGIRFRDS
jgi:asparagine synthase (glutamine-hydrolysing)